MSSNSQGFIAGWAGATVEVRRIAGATVEPLLTNVGTDPATISVSGSGSRWAAAWMEAGAAKCSTDGTVLNVAGAGSEIETAVLADGTVALTSARSGQGYAGSDSPGCPASLTATFGSSLIKSGVVAREPTGFVFVSVDSGGGLRHTDLSSGLQRQLLTADDFASAVTSNGKAILTAYEIDGGSLSLNRIQADLFSVGTNRPLITRRNRWWSVAACGPGCVAIAAIDIDEAAPMSVWFVDDDGAPAKGGPWDVTCTTEAPGSTPGTTVSLASFGGQLGVLSTSILGVRLFVCDLPP
jgi:hypothetical protein